LKQSPTWFDVYLVNVKSSGRLFQIFVAFSECPNFTDWIVLLSLVMAQDFKVLVNFFNSLDSQIFCGPCLLKTTYNNPFLVRSHCVIMYSACTSASCLQAAMHMHFTRCKFDDFSFTSFSCHFSCSDKLRRWVSGLCTFLREIATFSSKLSHLTCFFLF
jgi:hypothetical protein